MGFWEQILREKKEKEGQMVRQVVEEEKELYEMLTKPGISAVAGIALLMLWPLALWAGLKTKKERRAKERRRAELLRKSQPESGKSVRDSPGTFAD